jgi:alpha-L-rhamnosidase
MVPLSHKRAEGGNAAWAQWAAWTKKISEIGYLAQRRNEKALGLKDPLPFFRRLDNLEASPMSSDSPAFLISETVGIFQRFNWPISWITLPNAGEPPYVLGFRLIVDQPHDTTLRCHVTADERYELFLNGELIARGSERGSAEAWYYETLDIPVKAGRQILFARVWALDVKGPYAQCSVRPGFLFGAEQGSTGDADARWGTGLAPWEVKRIDGYDWIDDLDLMDGHRYPWGIELGEGGGWTKAVSNAKACTSHPTDLYPIRLLVPRTLPPMIRRPVPAGRIRFVEDVSLVEDIRKHRIDTQRHLPELADQIRMLLEGRSSLRVPPHKKYRAIIDFQNYFCAYPQFLASRGNEARITMGWAESLFEEVQSEAFGPKGNRNEIEGRLFSGYADTFLLEGGVNRSYTTLWWEAGRYVELLIETRDEELVLHRLGFEETRYPLEAESTFSASDERLPKLAPILLRTLQANAHETFMDPYYEQLNYTGDTLIICAVVYAVTRDMRLVRKSLQLFNDSRIPQGLTQSRFPSRSRQIIPPFSLLWVSMVRNHAWWRGEADFIRSLLPGVRAVLDAHLQNVNSQGLLKSLRGWNFLDWAWKQGVPPDSDPGKVSGPHNWLFVYALQAAVELETFAGEPELAARYSRLAQAHAQAAEAAFWNEERGLFADDLEHQHFSEHAQCLALLSGRASESAAARAAEGLLSAPDLRRCTIYFSHYLFETFRKLGRPEPLFARLEYWHSLLSQGFVTTPEETEPSRSDCHAWGSHPLFHYYATILGIRPSTMGFTQVEIRPQLGPLQNVSGRMVHPAGWIEVELRRVGEKLEGKITLPEGVTGVFHGTTGAQILSPGLQTVSA